MLFFSRKNPSLYDEIFSDPNDPRIEFYTQKLSTKQLETIVALRRFALEDTVFKHQRLGLGNNYLVRPAVRGSYGMVIKPEVNENITALILKTTDNQFPEARWPGANASILVKHQVTVDVAGWRGAILVSGIAFGIWMMLSSYTNDYDKARKKIVDINRKEGKCIWTQNGCEGTYGSKYDCYLSAPGHENERCAYSELTGLLTILTFLVTYSALSVLHGFDLAKRATECIKLMKIEFDSEQHDAMLNDLCQQEGMTDIKPGLWSEEICLNEQTYSLRKLVLATLASFDDRLYTKVFGDFLPHLNKGEAFLSIQPDLLAFFNPKNSIDEETTTRLRT